MAKTSCYLSDKFLQYFDSYSATLHNDRTISEYKGTISILCDHAKKDFLELSVQDVESFFNYMAKRVCQGSLTKGTVNVRLSNYRQMAAFITDHYPEEPYQNPFLQIQPASGLNNQINPSIIPSLKEIDQFLSCVDSPMYYLIFCMAFRIALSASAIITMRLSYVQKLDDNYCLHYPPKDRFSPDRVIVLPNDIAQLLLSYIDNMPYIDESGHLFYNKHNNPLTARNLDAYFEKIWKKSGIETKYTLKDLRSRSILDMVSAAIRSGSDLPTVGAYVGIKDLRLNTYVSANTIVGDCPADLVNFQIKN